MNDKSWSYSGDGMGLVVEDMAIDRYSMFVDSLVARWPDFVDCSLRLKTEGPFLLSALSGPEEKILDAAMGMGCETLFLAKHGFNVVGNEIDLNFRKLASMHARCINIELNTTSLDWVELAEYFSEGAFNAVLVLGNSLCLLQDEIVREQAVQNFRKVCKAGGKVIVDQRNFDYIFRNPTSSLGRKFRYSRKVMYCGTEVAGYPISVTPDCVRFAYEDVSTGSVLGYLDMHPFQGDEMVHLFRKIGFEKMTLYSDLEIGYRRDADFYTYIFR